MDIGRATVFPDYIAEDSAEGLRLAMFENNVKHGVQFTYFNIQYVDGFWYAWFNVEINDSELEILLDSGKRKVGK